MGILINGSEFDTDDEGYLLEPQLGDDVPAQIAAADGLTLTDAHWTVIRYLRDAYRETGHTPNFRAMLKELAAIDPALDNKALYDLFPMGPAKQGVRIAGLPKPYGKGGY
jgi:tRNA 2-thiouridine synthesizing protein E